MQIIDKKEGQKDDHREKNDLIDQNKIVYSINACSIQSIRYSVELYLYMYVFVNEGVDLYSMGGNLKICQG